MLFEQIKAIITIMPNSMYKKQEIIQ